MTHAHTTAQDCTVTVRLVGASAEIVGESVEIVVQQPSLHRAWCARLHPGWLPTRPDPVERKCDCGAGSVRTFTCSQEDAGAIGSMLVFAARPRPSDDGGG